MFKLLIGIIFLCTPVYSNSFDSLLTGNTIAYINNAYHEARGEPIEGILGVIDVTYNRVLDRRWPDTAQSVVWQSYQFSWTTENSNRKGVMPTPNTDKDMRALDQIVDKVLAYRRGEKYPLTTVNHFLNPSGLRLNRQGVPIFPLWARCEEDELHKCITYKGVRVKAPDYTVGGHWFYTL